MSKNSTPKLGEMGAESEYRSLSTEEVREIAGKLLGGQIFGSWQIDEHSRDLLGMIFMPLILADDLLRKQWERDEIAHFYGDMKDTMSRSINGYPIFHSMRALTLADTKRIVNMAKKMQEAMNEIEED